MRNEVSLKDIKIKEAISELGIDIEEEVIIFILYFNCNNS